MNTEVELFLGSFISSAGGIFKAVQSDVIDIPTIEEAKVNVNKFLSRTDIEIISVSHQASGGIISILVHYRKIGFNSI